MDLDLADLVAAEVELDEAAHVAEGAAEEVADAVAAEVEDVKGAEAGECVRGHLRQAVATQAQAHQRRLQPCNPLLHYSYIHYHHTGISFEFIWGVGAD